MKYAIALIAFLSLGGCGLSQRMAEQRNAEDDAKCISYGAQRGDPTYIQCRAQLDAARTQAAATESVAGAVTAAGPNPLASPPMVQPPPITYYPANHR
jgi:hypothetical protein